MFSGFLRQVLEAMELLITPEQKKSTLKNTEIVQVTIVDYGQVVAS